MLSPTSRRLLLDGLRPPAGYQLDRAVGTSYSLDLLALLTAPLAFTFFDWEDEEGRPTADPLALLQAVRRNAERIHLFCQAGQAKVPRPGQTLLAYLEGSVFEVEAPRGGVFHPKVWVLRFVSATEPVRYRLLCMSRNLTFDRSWDTALVLDGELKERKNAFGANHPLGDFVAALPDMALHPIPVSVAAGVEQLQEEIRRVEFTPPQDFDSIAFHPMGLTRRSHWPFPETHKPCVVISPFVSASIIKRLTERRRETVLISRPEELDALPKQTLDNLSEVLTLAPSADADVEGPDEEQESEASDETLSGLHAKLFVIDDGWDARIWTGSANATHAAFHRNVEFLVELRGKKKLVGPEALLREGEPGRGAATLRALLQPYARQTGEPSRGDPDQIELEKMLDGARRTVAAARLVARITPSEEGAEYAVDLFSAAPKIKLPGGVYVECWPTSLRPDSAVPLELNPRNGSAARFGPLSFAALTGFFAFALRVSDGNKNAEVRFALNLPLENEPENRREDLLRALLRDRDQVMRLLQILLSDGDLSVSDLVAAAAPGLQQTSQRSAGWTSFPLLESLLRALDRDPSRLDEVDRLIRDLNQTAEGRDLLPEGIESIWRPIWDVRKKQISPSAKPDGKGAGE